MTAVNESSATQPLDDANGEAPARRRVSLARRSTPENRAARRANKPMRTAGIVVAVTALVATVALPAIGAVTSTGAQATNVGAAMTLQQAAEDGSQSFVAASDVAASAVDRGSYSATTPEEIEKKKAEEAAIARAKAAAAEAAAAASVAAAASGNTSAAADIDLNMVAAGSGAVRNPLNGAITSVGEGLYARGGAHQGIDLVAPEGTPIYAAHSGTVTVSSEGYFGYGVAVEISGNVGGNDISTRYAHMTYGSRLVSVGQQVEAGQMIGRVGNTGNSYGAHLHFETRSGGALIDPQGWLMANGGWF